MKEQKYASNMTKQEFFAALALAGMIAATEAGEGYPEPLIAAEKAHEYARALIEKGDD